MDGVHGAARTLLLLSTKCHTGLQTEKPGKVRGYFTEDPNAIVEFGVGPVGNVKLPKAFN